MAGGRPKKTVELLTKLWPTWKEEILQLYDEGGSNEEAMRLIDKKTGGKISASNDLWQRWMKEEPEFSETIKRGRIWMEAYYVKTGREGMWEQTIRDEKGNTTTKKLNYTGWYMQMKNRFGWSDKVEQDTTIKTDPEQEFVVYIKDKKAS